MKALGVRFRNSSSGSSITAANTRKDLHNHGQNNLSHTNSTSIFPSTPSKLAPLNYIQALVDLGFISFMIPYRITWAGNGAGYRVFQNKIHQALCVICQGLVIYEMITLSWLMFIHRRELQVNNKYYIPIAHSLKCGLLCVILIFTFCLRKGTFLEILGKIQKLQFLQKTDVRSER